MNSANENTSVSYLVVANGGSVTLADRDNEHVVYYGVRDGAIDALLACADGRARGMPEYIADYATAPQTALAHAVFRDVMDRAALHLRDFTDAAVCLEAAGVLRDGWCPGDPIRLLRGRGAK